MYIRTIDGYYINENHIMAVLPNGRVQMLNGDVYEIKNGTSYGDFIEMDDRVYFIK